MPSAGPSFPDCRGPRSSGSFLPDNPRYPFHSPCQTCHAEFALGGDEGSTLTGRASPRVPVFKGRRRISAFLVPGERQSRKESWLKSGGWTGNADGLIDMCGSFSVFVFFERGKEKNVKQILIGAARGQAQYFVKHFQS